MVDVLDRSRTLISIAREAIERNESPLEGRPWPEPWLCERAASFVTLRLDGELHGCIGTVDPHRTLGDDVAHNAFAAAYRDRRFEPLTEDERRRVAVEVSVLSPREIVRVDSEEAALAALRPGVDGVYFEFANARATFLPQVWDNLPDPLDFLCELRRKAGLPTRFWHEGVKLSRYTVEKYL